MAEDIIVSGSLTVTNTVTASNFVASAGGRIQMATVSPPVTQYLGATYTTMTNWNYVGGAVRMSAATNTGIVTITNAGTYFVVYQMSASSAVGEEVECALHRDGVEQTHLEFHRTFGAGNAIGSGSFNGLLTTTTNNTPVSVRALSSSTATLTVHSQQLTIQRAID